MLRFHATSAKLLGKNSLLRNVGKNIQEKFENLIDTRFDLNQTTILIFIAIF